MLIFFLHIKLELFIDCQGYVNPDKPSVPFLGHRQTADPDQMPQNVASDQDLHCLLTGISTQNRIKWKSTPDTPKIGNGLIRLIRLGKSTWQMWVKNGMKMFCVFYKSISIIYYGFKQSNLIALVSKSFLIWAASWQNPTKWPLRSAQCVAKDPSFLHVDSEDSDQTGQMPRLIWIFAGRTCHFVGFVMRRLIYIAERIKISLDFECNANTAWFFTSCIFLYKTVIYAVRLDLIGYGCRKYIEATFIPCVQFIAFVKNLDK